MKYQDTKRAISQLRRDALLRDAGYEVVHFTWREVTEMPLYVWDTVQAAFERGDSTKGRAPTRTAPPGLVSRRPERPARRA